MVMWVYSYKSKVFTLLAVSSLANNVFFMARLMLPCLCFSGAHDGGWRTGVEEGEREREKNGLCSQIHVILVVKLSRYTLIIQPLSSMCNLDSEGQRPLYYPTQLVAGYQPGPLANHL